MADSRDARPSTDEETAPLLQDVSHPDAPQSEHTPPTFSERISSIVQEPLSPLSKILFVVALFFLLLSSIFIGLFAGAQHKLNRPSGGEHEKETITTTISYTATATLTATSISTGISTATSTTTVTSTVSPPTPTTPPEEPACLTPQCIMLAASVLSSLDTTQDPCENFFDFANGGWLKAHPIPSDKGSIGNFELLTQDNRLLIQQILSQDSSSVYTSALQTEPGALESSEHYDELLLRKLRGLYRSCMNEDLLNARGQDPLIRVVRTIGDLFSRKTTVVNGVNKDEDAFPDGLTAAVAYLHSRGVDALFSAQIEGDVGEDPNFMTLLFGQPSLGLPSKEYYDDESIVELYQSVLERLLVTLYEEDAAFEAEESEVLTVSEPTVHEDRLRVWPPWPWPPWDGGEGGDDGDEHGRRNRTEEAPILARNVVEFEKKIANASLDLDILYQDPIATYNPVPFSNLSKALPEFDFKTYLSTFAPRNFPGRVILDSLSFPESLSRILNETSRDTIQAYLETRAALELSPHLGTTTEAWKAVRSLEERLRGIKPGAIGDRSEYCVGRVEAAMGFAAGRYFVKEVFGGSSREKGTKVITDIIETFKLSLTNLTWMDGESASAAAQKADAIRVKVGFPLSPDTRNARSLAAYYNLVKVQETAFFENMLSARVNDQIKMWFQLGKRRDPEAWEMYPSMVNAYFNPPANEIVFPAGILQPPFFSQDWPAYMSYGAFGQVASHELTHAFDSAGRLYNQNGKLEEWWTNSTSEGFNKIQKCISDQYSSYYVDDGHGGKVYVNGNLTSGENIGDSGLIQAFRAWKANFQKSSADGDEFLLPGLNYTREQMFFIAFGRIWAQNIKPESAVSRVRSDPHSPNRFRVDGTVSNIPEFAEAFKCSSKAKLNPPIEKRCVFWG
ncbi:Peptidase M13 [Abortiporus biennis]